MFCELHLSVRQVPILEKSCHVTEVQCVREAYTVSPTSEVYFRQDRDVDHDNVDARLCFSHRLYNVSLLQARL